MKTIKNEIRPEGYAIFELSHKEINTLISLFEDMCWIKNIPFTEINGTRKEIYDQLNEALSKNIVTLDNHPTGT